MCPTRVCVCVCVCVWERDRQRERDGTQIWVFESQNRKGVTCRKLCLRLPHLQQMLTIERGSLGPAASLTAPFLTARYSETTVDTYELTSRHHTHTTADLPTTFTGLTLLTGSALSHVAEYSHTGQYSAMAPDRDIQGHLARTYIHTQSHSAIRRSEEIEIAQGEP